MPPGRRAVGVPPTASLLLHATTILTQGAIVDPIVDVALKLTYLVIDAAGRSIVAIVVIWATILSLVAVFHTINVDKRNCKYFQMLGKPSARIVITHRSFEDSFEDERRDRLAGVVPRGEEELPVLRSFSWSVPQNGAGPVLS